MRNRAVVRRTAAGIDAATVAALNPVLTPINIFALWYVIKSSGVDSIHVKCCVTVGIALLAFEASLPT